MGIIDKVYICKFNEARVADEYIQENEIDPSYHMYSIKQLITSLGRVTHRHCHKFKRHLVQKLRSRFKS